MSDTIDLSVVKVSKDVIQPELLNYDGGIAENPDNYEETMATQPGEFWEDKDYIRLSKENRTYGLKEQFKVENLQYLPEKDLLKVEIKAYEVLNTDELMHGEISEAKLSDEAINLHVFYVRKNQIQRMQRIEKLDY